MEFILRSKINSIYRGLASLFLWIESKLRSNLDSIRNNRDPASLF